MDQCALVPTAALWIMARVWSCPLPHCHPSVSKQANYTLTLAHKSYRMTKNPLCTAPPSGPCLVQCMNGGSCFLNAHKQPKCRCQPNYGGDRCEIDQCRDYCKNGGTCTPSPTGDLHILTLMYTNIAQVTCVFLAK